jgi:hypothetical protein
MGEYTIKIEDNNNMRRGQKREPNWAVTVVYNGLF